ncbi:MAG: hypothetical protein Q7T59_05315 [Candidatus Woesebacteria bacterium]|nr:hypothetical protein [Candidatus Woesebacteria bacterium]
MPEASEAPQPIEEVVKEVKNNPFGLNRNSTQIVNTELVDKVKAIQERQERLKNNLISVEDMTESEKAAYLLKNLKG